MLMPRNSFLIDAWPMVVVAFIILSLFAAAVVGSVGKYDELMAKCMEQENLSEFQCEMIVEDYLD